MCGIAGIVLDKKAVEDVISNKARYDVGGLLIRMSLTQQIRGQDSFGLALFNPPLEDQYKFMIACCKGKETSIRENFRGLYISEESVSLEPIPGNGKNRDTLIGYNVEERTREIFLQKLLALKADDCWIVSHGNYLTILKDIGLVSYLSGKWFDVANLTEITDEYTTSRKPWKNMRYETHGLAHVRIATATNVSHRNAHPFCCANVGDIAVVHNGEVTNAAKIRKDLVLKNYDLYSDNDTEVIAAFIGNRLSRDRSLTLEEACREFIEIASGYYTCLIATPSEVAFIKDIGATRPALYGYHSKDEDMPGFYAVATDISALAAVNATTKIGTVEPGGVKIFPTGLSYQPKKIQVEVVP